MELVSFTRRPRMRHISKRDSVLGREVTNLFPRPELFVRKEMMLATYKPEYWKSMKLPNTSSKRI
jgi:hypothetical protein